MNEADLDDCLAVLERTTSRFGSGRRDLLSRKDAAAELERKIKQEEEWAAEIRMQLASMNESLRDDRERSERAEHLAQNHVIEAERLRAECAASRDHLARLLRAMTALESFEDPLSPEERSVSSQERAAARSRDKTGRPLRYAGE